MLDPPLHVYSFETLIEELNPLVTEKHEFDYGYESIVIALLEGSWLSGFCLKGQI